MIEGYFQNAWSVFMSVVNWMSETTILTVQGVPVTFLGLLLYLCAFNIALWACFRILGMWIDGDI